MDKKLNIAIFSDNFLPGVGGMENAVCSLATELTNLGHNVLVVVPHYSKKKENDNFPFKIFRKASFRVDSNNYCAFPNLGSKLKKVLREFKPDIVHCHSQASLLTLAMKTSKMFNIPCVCTMHTKYSYCYKNAVHLNCIVNPMLKAIGRKLKKLDKVIAVSYGMAEEFNLYGFHDKFEVVKNGATFQKSDDSNLKKYAQDKFNLKEDENILLFVGHISKIKNLPFIFESLDELYKTNKDFKMVFVGSGDGDDYFRKLAKSKEYRDKVLFTDKITDKKLLQSVYANAKLYIFPSIFDTDGLTIVEAAIYSVPSITIEGTGCSERITNNQNGFKIKNDPKEMAKKVDYLLNNQDYLREIGENACKQLPKSWTQASKEYLEIYYDTIENFNKNN